MDPFQNTEKKKSGVNTAILRSQTEATKQDRSGQNILAKHSHAIGVKNHTPPKLIWLNISQWIRGVNVL